MKAYTIKKGERKEVYMHINAKGKVYFKIHNLSGTNRLYFYWTKGPFGSNKHLGVLTGSGAIDIEGLIWGRLKVKGADSVTKLYITDKPEVASNFPTIEF